MTKRNKILYSLCLFALALCCAFGVFLNAGARDVRAETTLPTIDSSKIVGRDITLTTTASASSGSATCEHIVRTQSGAKNVDYIIIEWTNDENGYVDGGTNGMMYGAGQTSHHKNTVSATARSAMIKPNVNVKIYFNLSTGAVTGVVTTESGVATEYQLTAFTPVADYTTTATNVYLCFHSVTKTANFKDMKIYTSAGTSLKIRLGSRMRVTDLNDLSTPVSSKVEGNDYNSTSGAKYISTTKATSSDWIIFEMSTVAGQTSMKAGNNFYFGLGTTSGSANATNVGVSDWSPISPLNNGGTVRYFLSTKTGFIYVSTSALSEVPVLKALTASGVHMYTDTNVGLDSVYGKIYFNEIKDTASGYAGTIDLNGLKAYDEKGNDLGIATSLTIEVPEITNDTAKTVNLYEPANTNGFGNATASNAKWIIFEYTIGENTIFTSAGNNLYGGLSSTIAQYTATYLSDGDSIKIISSVGSDVKIMVDTETGNVYYSIDGGTFAKMAKSFGDKTAIEGIYAAFYFNVGMSATHIKNLKCYDSNGKDLGIVSTGFYQYIDQPDIDTSAVPYHNFISTGGEETYFVTNEKTTAEYIIFEWINGADNTIPSGGNSTYMGYGTGTGAWGGATHANRLSSYHGMFSGAGNTVKIYLNTRTGQISYYETGEFPNEGWARVIKNMTTVYDGTTGLYGGFCVHESGNSVIFNKMKVYDSTGKSLSYERGGVKFGLPEVDVSSIKGVNLRTTGTTCTYIASANATTSEWIIFDWTNVQNACPTGLGGSTYFGTSTTKGLNHALNNAASGYFVQSVDKHIRLLFNTRTGHVYVDNGGSKYLLKDAAALKYTGTPLYASYCIHSENNQALFENVKIYDGEGNNLGVVTSMRQEVSVTVTSKGKTARPNDNDYLLYWNVTDVDTSESLLPSYGFSSTTNPLNINGEEVYVANGSSAYTVGGSHCWVFNAKTLNAEFTSLYEVAPTELYFPVGYEFVANGYVYILTNEFYVYFSGTNVQVLNTPRAEISLLVGEEDSTSLIYSNQKRYQGNVYANIGGAPTEISLCNIVGKKNGTNEEVLLWWEYGNNTSYMYLTELDADYTSHLDVTAQWYLLPAGSVIGNIYTLDADYVLQINGDTINLFRRDKVFTVTYDNLQGATAPAETTFSYANDFEITLPSIEAPRGYEFLGWEYNGNEITTITPGMFGSDITVTAILEKLQVEVSLKQTVTATSDDSNAGYKVTIPFIDGESVDVTTSNFTSLQAKLNGAGGENVVLSIGAIDGNLLFYYSSIQDGATTAGQISNKYFYIPAGTIIGDDHLLSEAIVIIIDDGVFTVAKAGDYNLTYTGLNDGDSHTNPATYNYANGNLTLVEPTYDTEAYTFLGWFIDDVMVTSVFGITSDVTITAIFEEIVSLPGDVEAPAGDGVTALFNVSGVCGHPSFPHNNVVANASAVSDGAKFIIFEWTNGENSVSSAYFGLNNSYQVHPANGGYKEIFASGKSVKLYANIVTGEIYYSIDGEESVLKATLAIPSLSNGQYVIATFCAHNFSGDARLNGLKIYDDLGKDLGVKIGGRGVSVETAPTVSTSATTYSYTSTSSCAYFNSGTATTSEWIIFEWTNGDANTVTEALNAFYVGIGTSSTPHHTTNGGFHLNRVFGKQGAKVKLYYNTREGYMGYSVEDLTAEGEIHVLKTGLATYTDTALYAGFCVHSTNACTFTNLKVYDGAGNDLGVRFGGVNIETPDVNTSSIAGKDYQHSAQAAFYNASAPSANAKWIIFEWTVGGGTINALSNSFHMSVKNDGTTGSGAQPQGIGSAISTLNSRVYIMFNIENGMALYKIVNGETVTQNVFNYLTLPSLSDGQYYTVTILFNGWDARPYITNDVKIYDDLGKDLGVNASAMKRLAPVIDSSEMSSKQGIATTTHTYIANATPTHDEWIILEWTNLANALSSGAGATGFGISTTGGNIDQMSNPSKAWYMFNVSDLTTVKLYFNTRHGELFLMNDSGALSLIQAGLNTYNGTPMYASFCIHKDSTAKVTGIKAYDGEGNDLGVDTNFLDVPAPDVSGIQGTTLKIASPTGTIRNTNGANANAKWIIFDWTNGDGANKINNPSNAFHMVVSNDGSASFNSKTPMPEGIGGHISTANANVRILVNILTGEAYYQIDGATPVRFKTLPLPELTGEQYHTVGLYINGLVNSTSLFVMNNLKVYDDLGNDLVVKATGNWYPEIPAPTVPGGAGVAGKSISSCAYVSNATATTSEWIFMEWTNVTEVAVSDGGNSAYCYIGTSSGLNHGSSLGGTLFNAFNKESGETVKLAFNTQNGKVYKSYNGGLYSLAGTLAGISYDGTTPVYACFCIHATNTAEITELKVYDAEGNDLGAKTNFLDYPIVDSSTKSTTDVIFNQSCGGDGYIYMDNAIVNASGVGDGAKWIIFEWTNGASNNVGSGNGAFMGIQNASDRTSHAKNGVGGLFAANGVMKLYVNVETGKTFYFNGSTYTSIGTLDLPELTGEQYAIVNFGPHSFSGSVILTDVKCYDDLGNDLGVRVGGKGAILAAEPIVDNNTQGQDMEAVSGALAVGSEVATTSEWIIFEWTNGNDTTYGSSHNAFYVNIVDDSSAELTAAHRASEHIARIFGAQGKKVKIYFNTRQGYMAYSVEDFTGDGEIHIAATGLGTTDGTTPVYAKFNTVVSVVGKFNDFKCYDGDGNDLVSGNNFAEVVSVTFDLINVDVQPHNERKNVGTEEEPVYEYNPRWLFYWNVTNTATGELIYPSYTFGSGSRNLALNLNGEIVKPTYASSAYTYVGKHTWVLYVKTVADGLNDMYELAPTVLYFEAGYKFVGGGYSCTLAEPLYVHLSRDTVSVTHSELEAVYLNDCDFVESDDMNARFNTLLTFEKGNGDVVDDFCLANFYAYVNGASGEKVLVKSDGIFDQENSMQYIPYSAFDSEANLATDIEDMYLYVPAGTMLGSKYVLGEALVFMIRGGVLTVFEAGEYTITYEGLLDGQTHNNPLTVNYADGIDADCFAKLTRPSSVEGYSFSGWYIDDQKITNLYGITSDVVVTAGVKQIVGKNMVFNRTCGGHTYISYDNSMYNSVAPGEGAKWIFVEWTNDQANIAGTVQGLMMGITTSGGSDSHDVQGLQRFFTGGTKVLLKISLETGEVYGSIDGAELSLATTLTLPNLNAGQYYVVTICRHSVSGITRIYDVVMYDDVDTDLDVRPGGNAAGFADAPTVSADIDGIDVSTDGSMVETRFVSEASTVSEWIIFEWTNGADNSASDQRSGPFRFSISTRGEVVETFSASLHFGSVFGTPNVTVKLCFNTRYGYVGYNVPGITGEDEIHIIKYGLTTYDGASPLYASVCMHSAVTGTYSGFKCYDGDGNDLGFNDFDTFVKTVNVTFNFDEVEIQENHITNGDLNSRYIIYWDVVEAGTNKSMYPTFAFGDDEHSFVLNGETVFPEIDVACHTYNGKHAWILYTKTLTNGSANMTDVLNTAITFEAGYSFRSGNTTYVIEHDLTVYISGKNVQALTTDSPVVNVTADTSFVYASEYNGYFGNAVVNYGNVTENINMYNVVAYKNGTEEVIFHFETVEVSTGVYKDLLTITELNANYAGYRDVEAQYYVIKAGSRIGNVYTVSEDVVIQVNGTQFNVFNRSKVFKIAYANVQGATNPNVKTFSYATDFNIVLQDLPNPAGFVFNGWKIGDTEITSISAGEYGSDIVITADLSDGESSIEILERISITLYDSISLTFYVRVSVYDVNDLTAKFTFTYSDEEAPKTVNRATFVAYQKFNDNSAIYKVTYNGILPQHLCDDVELKIYAGATLLGTYSASVLDYCSSVLKVTDPDDVNTDDLGLAMLKTLVCDIVEYGTAMQEMIVHDVENTPKNSIDGYDGKLATTFTSAEGFDDYRKTGEYNESYYWKSAMLVYDNVPTLVFNFIAPVESELSVTLSYEGLDTPIVNTVITMVEDALPTYDVAEFQARFFFPPYFFDEVVELNINDGGVQFGQTLYYSVNAYIARMLEEGSVVAEEKATLKRIYNYGVSAKAFSDYNSGMLYTVSFNLNGGHVNGSSCDDQLITFGRNPVQPSEEPVRDGYVFAGWDYDFESGIAGDLVINALWKARTDVVYTVEYYLPSANGSGYELRESLEMFGTTDQTANALIKDFSGYEYDDSIGTVSGIVLSDGSLVLSVYYKEIELPVIDGWTTYSEFSKTPIQTSIAKNIELDGFTATSAMNKYKLVYSLDKPVKVYITIGDHTEDFFLEAGEYVTFTSFTDDVLGDRDSINAGKAVVHNAPYVAGSPLDEKVTDGKSFSGEISLTFEPIVPGETVNFKPLQLAITYQKVEDKVVYVSNERFKVGAHLYYGGALTYYEDLQDGRDDIGNLVNIHDGGRLIQQSYYGTDEKANGGIGYNPVQGGNGYGFSKIIDYEVTDDTIYVKARAKSWKDTSKTGLSDSYMENWYTVTEDYVKVENTFVDFLNANNGDVSQECPAFYVVGGLNTVVFYEGSKPWTNDNLNYYYAKNMQLGNNAGKGGRWMNGGETWSAWINQDGWGVGAYTPGASGFGSWLSGGEIAEDYVDVYNPYAGQTAYFTLSRSLNITQFEKVSYSYIMTSGQLEDIRNVFKENKDYAVNEFPESFGDTYDFTNIDFTEPTAIDFTQRFNNASIVYDADRQATKVAITGTGIDPYFGISLQGSYVRPLAEIYPYISIEYMIPEKFADALDGNSAQIYLGVGDNEWVSPTMMSSFTLIADGRWHVAYIDFSQYEWYTGIINLIRLDLAGNKIDERDVEILGTEYYIRSIKLCETMPVDINQADDYAPTAKTWLTRGANAGNYHYAKGGGSGVQSNKLSYYAHGWFLVGDGIDHFEFMVYEKGTKANNYIYTAEAEKDWMFAKRGTITSYYDPALSHPNIGDDGSSAAYSVNIPLNRYTDGKTYTIKVRVVTNSGYACLFDSFDYTYTA